MRIRKEFFFLAAFVLNFAPLRETKKLNSKLNTELVRKRKR
jgi:hypothetical protein